MTDTANFKPKSVFTIYIAATPEKVWQAVTSPEFTRQYFFGRSIEFEPKPGGTFILRMPDGRVDVRGRVVDCDPPRRLAVTWRVEWLEEMRELPECFVVYEIVPVGEAVRLTVTQAFSWDVPEALLASSRMGWPAILSSLKSLLETGKPIAIKLEPPPDMMKAIREVIATKPWLRS